MSETVEVTSSCGCVFCDLGLAFTFRDGRPAHEHPTRGKGWTWCDNRKLSEPMPEAATTPNKDTSHGNR